MKAAVFCASSVAIVAACSKPVTPAKPAVSAPPAPATNEAADPDAISVIEPNTVVGLRSSDDFGVWGESQGTVRSASISVG